MASSPQSHLLFTLKSTHLPLRPTEHCRQLGDGVGVEPRRRKRRAGRRTTPLITSEEGGGASKSGVDPLKNSLLLHQKILTAPSPRVTLNTADISGTTSESNRWVRSEEGCGEPSTAINCVGEEKWPYSSVNLGVRERSNHHLPPPTMALFF